MNEAQEHREKAERARRLASAVTDAVVREQLELAAKDYDEMVKQVEEGAARDE